MSDLLQLDGLVKHFGALTAVDNITLDVGAGQVLGFLGPNGAGKSTTMKMAAGFLPPDNGRAVICGHDVVLESRLARQVLGYLPEGAPAYGEMTPRSFLAFCADVRGLMGGERKRCIDDAVARTSLEKVYNQSIETLSKGFKRRVGLAQAIMHEPKVLILDEPTDGLDPNQKHQVRQLIRDMAQDRAIIVSTHILEEVDAVCTRAVIINKGKVVADGTGAELRKLKPGAKNLEQVFRHVTTGEDAQL